MGEGEREGGREGGRCSGVVMQWCSGREHTSVSRQLLVARALIATSMRT